MKKSHYETKKLTPWDLVVIGKIGNDNLTVDNPEFNELLKRIEQPGSNFGRNDAGLLVISDNIPLLLGSESQKWQPNWNNSVEKNRRPVPEPDDLSQSFFLFLERIWIKRPQQLNRYAKKIDFFLSKYRGWPVMRTWNQQGFSLYGLETMKEFAEHLANIYGESDPECLVLPNRASDELTINATESFQQHKISEKKIYVDVPVPVPVLHAKAIKWIFKSLRIPADWAFALTDSANDDFYIALQKIDELYNSYDNLEPPREDLYASFVETPFDEVKVVIFGQDPYHGEGQTDGMAFSVREGYKVPPSLRNIFKELEADCGIKNESGNLKKWANQGVLLLNVTPIVERGMAFSYRGIDNQAWLQTVLDTLMNKKENIVYILFGGPHKKMILPKFEKNDLFLAKNLVLYTVHPSPLSANRGFYGSKIFSRTNDYLKIHGKKPIDWKL